MTQDKKNYRKKIISFYKVSLSKKNLGKYNDEKKA